MEDFLDRVYYNNTVEDYLIALGIIVVGILIIRLFKNFILNRIKKLTVKTSTKLDDFLVDNFSKYGIPAIYVIIAYSGINYLIFSERVENILSIALTMAITVLVVMLISNVIRSILRFYLARGEGGEERVKQLAGLMLIINIFIWTIGLIFLFNNLGYDVTAIIAGMGIGGIAIALAAQNILGDLFNYFVILFDRPFEVGDFLIIDQKLGSVEKIGIKTTHIRSLSGEQLIFSNSDLMNSRIHNYKRMQRRRIVFKVGVTYQTTLEQLRQIPPIIKSLVEELDQVTFDRSHFQAYGDSSLDFETVYWVEVSDYNVYMDKQQHINLRIYEEFERIGVEIAYPTRTLYLNTERSESENETPVMDKISS